MNRHAGSTLIELLVYLVVGAFLIGMVAMASVIWRTHTSQLQERLSHQIATSAGLDLLVRDIQQAPIELRLWHANRADALMWHGARNLDYGYAWKDQKLIRTEGQWSEAHNLWLHKTQSLVLSDVTACSFVLNIHQNEVRSISYSVSTHGISKEKTVHLQAGEIIT